MDVVGEQKLNYKGFSFLIADFEFSGFEAVMGDDIEKTTAIEWGTRTYGT